MELASDRPVSIGRLRRDLTLEELFPGLARFSGPIDADYVPTACRHAVRQNAPTWETLRTVSIEQMELWPMVGPGRISTIIQFCRTFAELSGYEQEPGEGTLAQLLDPGQGTSAADSVRNALEILGSWAMTVGIQDDLETCLETVATTPVPPSVIDSAAFIESLRLATFATDAQRARLDPMAAAQQLIAEFDEREQDILERVLTDGIRPTATLEELGAKHGVTRERIRQLERPVAQKFSRLVADERFEMVKFHAERIRQRCGAGAPVGLAPSEVIPRDDDTIVDELFANLAGPYRVSDGWIYLQAFGETPFEVVSQAFANTAAGFLAPLDAMLDDLEAKGFNPITAMMLIEDCEVVRVLSDNVTSWRKYEDKVGGVLQDEGGPLNLEEIAERLGVPDKQRSIGSHLAAASHAHRVGVRRWALREWGLAEYRSLVEHMVERLEFGPCDLDTLAASLAENFGVSPNSVSMYASMHPLFVLEAGEVRLRGTHEPYQPDTELRDSDGCFVVDKAWAYRTRVDRDLLRGSGRTIPEAFAVHVGLRPGGKITLRCQDHDVNLAWNGVAPVIGSLRWYAHKQRLVEGDYLFIRASGRGELDLRCVRKTDFSDSPNETRLLRVIGSHAELDNKERVALRRSLIESDIESNGGEGTGARSVAWWQLSESLGYLPSENPSSEELRRALRRHSDLPQLDLGSPDNTVELTPQAVDRIRHLPELGFVHPGLADHLSNAAESLVGQSFDLENHQPARHLVLEYVNPFLEREGLERLAEPSLLFQNLQAKLTAAIRSAISEESAST